MSSTINKQSRVAYKPPYKAEPSETNKHAAVNFLYTLNSPRSLKCSLVWMQDQTKFIEIFFLNSVARIRMVELKRKFAQKESFVAFSGDSVQG